MDSGRILSNLPERPLRTERYQRIRGHISKICLFISVVSLSCILLDISIATWHLRKQNLPFLTGGLKLGADVFNYFKHLHDLHRHLASLMKHLASLYSSFLVLKAMATSEKQKRFTSQPLYLGANSVCLLGLRNARKFLRVCRIWWQIKEFISA